jgi:preprotein translocase subunit SecA
METFKLPEDMPIENGMISKSIESAQSKIEGMNFDARKHVLEYDDVLNKHREGVYSRRKQVLENNNLKETILELLPKYNISEEDYKKKEEEIGSENMRQLEKVASLRVLDTLWIEHLENMESLRDSVRLRAFGQRDPLIEYKKEGFKMFNDLLSNYESVLINTIMKAGIAKETKPTQTEEASQRNEIIKGDEVGRNDLCPCGSGKKYKKCCGKDK